MKSWVWLVVLVIVILVVFAVMAAVRPKTAEAPFVIEESPGEEMSPGGQPIQLVPSESLDLPAGQAGITTSPSESPVVTAATVSISDTDFTPEKLVVKSGTTVVFTNNGQALHWPASDPHPAHTVLAGFDAKKGLATGESYSFTFSKAGTWGFHDHLNVQLKGSVVVE